VACDGFAAGLASVRPLSRLAGKHVKSDATGGPGDGIRSLWPSAFAIHPGIAAFELTAARVKVFFLFRLPPFMERNHDLAEKLLVAHTIVAHLLFILIALHASAALFHHFIRRDETLSGWRWHRQATRDSPRFVL
jgi:hypothetical protein